MEIGSMLIGLIEKAKLYCPIKKLSCSMSIKFMDSQLENQVNGSVFLSHSAACVSTNSEIQVRSSTYSQIVLRNSCYAIGSNHFIHKGSTETFSCSRHRKWYSIRLLESKKRIAIDGQIHTRNKKQQRSRKLMIYYFKLRERNQYNNNYVPFNYS